jgi:hypothetical protein
MPSLRYPREWIDTAGRIVSGTMSMVDALQEEQDANLFIGNIDRHPRYTWRAATAATAAYKSLRTVLDPPALVASAEQEELEDKLSDLELADSAGDVAASAAVAAAWDTNCQVLDPMELKRYWEHWLTELVPAACKANI